MSYSPVPTPTLQRLPAYLQLLKRLQREGAETVSCNVIAQELNLNPSLLTGFLEEKFGLPAVSANILRKKFLTADKQLFV